ncbi:MAG: polyphosphate polymerase domain-containing protein [Clostridia bacterium]
MATEVFSRYELKFLLDEKAFDEIHSQVQSRMTPDAYSRDGNFYTISNIYYDTPDNSLISTAVRHDGKYRYKIRLRTYDPTRNTAFLEIKKKYRGLTNKRRTTILIDDADRMLRERVFPKEQPFMNMQVTRELFDIAQKLTLVPKTVISYDRRAYFGDDPFEKDLRITFDSGVRARLTDLDLRSGSYGERLLEDNLWIMEVKVAHSVPLWVARMLSRSGVSHTHFSKYGTEYKHYLMENHHMEGAIVNA